MAKEVGSAAVRGSMRAVEQIGGDLLGVARGAVEGGLDAAGRIAIAADRAVRRVLNKHNPRATTRPVKESPAPVKERSRGSRRRKNPTRKSRSVESS
jgi:hypothetical protein